MIELETIILLQCLAIIPENNFLDEVYITLRILVAYKFFFTFSNYQKSSLPVNMAANTNKPKHFEK